jgi:hypothetical protein
MKNIYIYIYIYMRLEELIEALGEVGVVEVVEGELLEEGVQRAVEAAPLLPPRLLLLPHTAIRMGTVGT